MATAYIVHHKERYRVKAYSKEKAIKKGETK